MIDSHCHLTDQAYADDLDAVLQRAADAGVTGVVTIASNAEDARAARTLAATRTNVWWTAGIHPHEAESPVSDLARIADLLDQPGVVAVGETGLDYHYDNSPRMEQRRSFDAHLGMAADRGLPVVVHSREADSDTRAAILGASGVTGVLHCFTGGSDLLDAALDAGWYIGYGGMVTFRNWPGADLLRRVPEERLMLETDGPYLAPVPHRGRRNEPAWVARTCETIATLRSTSVVDIDVLTEVNTRRFYHLAPSS